MENTSLITYVRTIEGATSIKKANAGNGAFIAVTDATGKVIVTMPVGKNSQETPINELYILPQENGTLVATKRASLVEENIVETINL